MVVEDNDFARTLAVDALKQLGLRCVHGAHDAIEGLRVIRDTKLDFILLDWYMNEINGAGFVQLVREGLAACPPDTPIIICTAYATRENTARIRELGIREILIKPVDIKRLRTAISIAVSSYSPHKTSDVAADPESVVAKDKKEERAEQILL